MKRSIIAALSVFAFLFVSCQKEPVFEEEPVVKVTLKAQIQNEDTKVTLDRSERTLHWVDGDLVSINGVAYAASVSSSDDQSAEFSDVTESATGYRAYYPSTLEVGGKAVLPSSITYSADEFRMPMYASIADASEVFHFKNICGVLALKVKAIGDHNEVHSISVSSSDRAMSGPFTVEGGKAVVSSDATGSISVVCPTAVTVDATGTEFFVPIPEYDYQNFLICVNWADGTSMYMKSKSTFSIKRNVFYTVNFKDTGYVPEAVSILDGRRWSYTNMSNIGGTMQGAAETGGVIYQFSYSGSGSNSTTPFSTYDIATGVWTKHDALTCAPNLHAGSATFSPDLISTYTVDVDGEPVTKTTTVPFVYLTGHYSVSVDGKTAKYILIDVIDVVNDVLVKRYTFPNLNDDSIAAYDFENGKVWLLGYRTVFHGQAPYLIREFNVDLNSVAPAKTNFTLSDIVSEVEVGGPDTADGIQKDLNCGTLQDAFYKNGYIYFITGRGSDYHRTEWTKIHSYNTLTKELKEVYTCPDEQEAQGLTICGNDIYMTVTGTSYIGNGKRLWKFSLGSGYDSYNYEPATKTGEGTYSIANGSQLVWFKSQVYGGCTNLKAELSEDIDMFSVSDPYTFYVHEYPNANGEHTYEAQYAFRGEFDGKGHTISNISIAKTPYYNVGLFPYVIGGTIKNLTAKGNVTLTALLSWPKETTTSSEIQSVGLIGTLDGGTVSNVNSANFSVLNPSDLTLTNENGVSTLIGHVVTDSAVTIEDNTTSNGSHEESGSAHNYVNGVCLYDDCEDRYEEPEQVNGVYQISNAGNLWWFANYVNSQEGETSPIYVHADAVLTNSINMEGLTYGSFPGIGKSNQTIAYAGTFDGQGYTISDFYLSIGADARRSMFNYVRGETSTTKAVIKNFTLTGGVIVNATGGMYGAVVGDLASNSLIEDVTSTATITSNVTAPYVGGIVGALTGGATMNRCRFNGIVNGGNAVKGIGGLAGEVRGSTITNCLFDGTINSTSTSADLILGGIAGRNEESGSATIKYCFSNGIINLVGSSYTKVGAVLGSTAQGSTFVNTYYTTDRMSTSKFGVGNAGGVVTGSPNDITGSEDIYSGELHFQLGETNWLQTDFTEGHYPIPGPGGQHVHVFDADGFCRANDGEYQEPSLVDGYYEISNAGELFWFATKVNSGSKSIKAKLVSDIDMLGTKYIWPVIGNSTSNVFSGTFDGNNKRITNFNLPVANGQSRRGFIGIATGATIKNFTISGMMNCAATADTYFLGAVVGQADGSTKIEGVISDVDIVVSGGKERHVGGIVGVAGMATNSAVTIDRCRYSGNISVTTSYSGSVRASIGGICGNLRGAKINNSLFDGSITATATTTNTGGIVGAVSDQAPGSQLNNCFVNGSFSIADNTNNLNGSVIGTIVAVVTITNSYYVGTLTPVGSSTATLTGSATNVEGSTITDGTLLNSLGTDNWEAGTAGYPVPKMK